MRKIIAWSINVVWSDETEQVLTDTPTWVSKEIDNWLTELEEDLNESTEENE